MRLKETTRNIQGQKDRKNNIHSETKRNKRDKKTQKDTKRHKNIHTE